MSQALMLTLEPRTNEGNASMMTTPYKILLLVKSHILWYSSSVRIGLIVHLLLAYALEIPVSPRQQAQCQEV